MGCNTCRISQMDSQFFKACKTSKTYTLDFQPLLTFSQRKFWLQQLQIKGIPQPDFWSQFNGFHHTCFNQIAKDINRTFPTLTFFSHKTHVARFQLLLKKFAIYFPHIGYTQGLNFVAGYLLMCGFDDDEAFKILVSLMVHSKILAIGLYQDQFLLNRFYCEIKFPKIAQKIRKAHVQDQIWIFQWFISLFLYSFPTQVVKRFWDFIILKKQLSIVLVAIGIIRCLKTDIMNMKNPQEFDFLQFFQNLKDSQYCKGKIDNKKILQFINTITQPQIQKAIQDTKCLNNFYRIHFISALHERNQLHTKMMNYFKYERKSFKVNPKSMKYTRNIQVTNQLENLMLSKYKLYQSQYKKSNVASSIFKNSTFSIAVDGNQSLGVFDNKKSNIFSNPFLGKINFTQSKVIQNFDLSTLKKFRQSHSPVHKKGGINPFEQISQKNQQSSTHDRNVPIIKRKQKISAKQYGDFSKKKSHFYN